MFLGSEAVVESVADIVVATGQEPAAANGFGECIGTTDDTAADRTSDPDTGWGFASIVVDTAACFDLVPEAGPHTDIGPGTLVPAQVVRTLHMGEWPDNPAGKAFSLL